MSTQNRAGGGRKASKNKTQNAEIPSAVAAEIKEKKASADHAKPEKEKVQIKPTAEQIRIAQITDIKGGIEDPKIPEKVQSLMEMTQRSEEDVCCALYECDNDLERSLIFLLEQLPVGAFATTSKKKKSKAKEESAGDSEWNNENTAPNSTDTREKGRNRQGGGVSNGNRGSFGGRGRDNRKRENGGSDFKVDTFRSGGGSDRDKGKYKGNAPQGTRGGRGRQGPGTGRSNFRENRSRNVEHQEIDSWDASQGIVAEKQNEVTIDTWGDWDNEEYTGSLATENKKASYPQNSTIPVSVSNQSSELVAPPGLEQQILNSTTTQIDSYSSAISGSGATNVSSTTQSQYTDLHSGPSAAQQLRQVLEIPQIQSTTLSAEQSQYFNTLSSQNNAAQYSNSTFANNQYNSDPNSTRPAAGRRARVPPPSKIPSSAVEMPGDNLSNIGYLDVQFGGLDFGTEDSFDNVNDKFRESSLDTAQSLGASDVTEYQSTKNQSTAGDAINPSQLLSDTAVMGVQSDAMSASQSNTVGTSGYQPGTFSTNAKMASYQHNAYGGTSHVGGGYGSSSQNYPSNNTYNAYNQVYQQGGSVPIAAGTGNVPSNGSQSNTNANAGQHGTSQNTITNSYLSNQYSVNPSSTTSYTSQQNPYQGSQNFANTGLSSTQGTGGATSTTNTSISTSVNLSSPSLGLTNSKSVSSTAKGGSATVVPNIPMVSQYIQTPTGMPFYQPQVYSYEDLQMMQPRVSHMPGYYDLNYQTPTSLGAAGVREGSLGSVAYSTMSDARFTRTDNNSSPVSNVPSTISQQTGSGGPMLNLPYAYFYSSNAMMPGGFQYGAPAIYPQQMATASATSGGQFPKPSYNNSYGSSSYDNLSQGNQDYGKASYAGGGVGQNKTQSASNPQGGGSSGSDMTSSIYGKSHSGLGKVNSYESKSFHSGTPPPFNLVGSQTALNNASAQPYGSQHLYIPTIPAPHHNMNLHQAHQESSRQQSSNPGKTGAKQGYSPSYWAAQS